MNVTERSRVADDLVAALDRANAEPAERSAIAGMCAGKVIASSVEGNQRGQAAKALNGAMTAQLTLETAGEYRSLQPIGRLGMDDE